MSQNGRNYGSLNERARGKLNDLDIDTGTFKRLLAYEAMDQLGRIAMTTRDRNLARSIYRLEERLKAYNTMSLGDMQGILTEAKELILR